MDNKFNKREYKDYKEDEFEFECIEELDCSFDDRDEKKEKKDCFSDIIEDIFNDGFEKGFKEGCKEGYETAKKQLLEYMKKNKCCIKCRKHHHC